jgi:hypothetical protein
LLHFEAVDSAFIAWVNGVPIGYRYETNISAAWIFLSPKMYGELSSEYN